MSDKTRITSHLDTSGHRRRTSLLTSPSPATEESTLWSTRRPGNTSATEGPSIGAAQSAPGLDTIQDSPKFQMILDRSPSPQEGGGWSSPGLSAPARNARRSPSPGAEFGASDTGVTWATAQARSRDVKGFETSSKSWVPRNLSFSLPRFVSGTSRRHDRRMPEKYGSKEKVNRGRIPQNTMERLQMLGAVAKRGLFRLRAQLVLLLAVVLLLVLYYQTPAHQLYRRTGFLGGGNKFVIILATNLGGGVMEWKGAKEWAIERDSVRNKKKYAARHGYDLEIVDMSTKKRYAHEWRESWEKVDVMRRCMREYPSAEWFWWLDLNTFIMEPSYSLQRHVFSNLAQSSYRDINEYNPINITHPPDVPYLDDISRSAVGDGDPNSINMLVTQDCGGFNLGSFFMRRSSWTDRVLDIWWDPVHYEQRHMQWEHKEQDAFENLYIHQPWIRPHTAFLHQRKVNSFPPGACGENDTRIHYDEKDRDFLINMAGCEWGRDCWGEMYNYRELSNQLNRSSWEKLKDAIAGMWGQKSEKQGKEPLHEEQKQDAEHKDST